MLRKQILVLVLKKINNITSHIKNHSNELNVIIENNTSNLNIHI